MLSVCDINANAKFVNYSGGVIIIDHYICAAVNDLSYQLCISFRRREIFDSNFNVLL